MVSAWAAAIAALAAGLLPVAAWAATSGPGANPGERAFLYCYSCHSADPDEIDLPGPNLYGVVGRPVAAQAGFKYSEGLLAFARDNPLWTRELIERFMQDPIKVAPGTRMEPLPGGTKPKVRRLILEYHGRKR